MSLTVEEINATTFDVTVSKRVTTSHRVTVSEQYWRKLTEGRIPQQKLVEKSFEFLLDREPNTSILTRFDLPQIQEYFPDYEESIRVALS